MRILFQSSGFTEHHLAKLMDGLTASGLPYTDFGSVLSGEKPNAPRTPEELFPDVPVEHAQALSKHIKEQLSYDLQRFDQAYYNQIPELRPHLLNGEARSSA